MAKVQKGSLNELASQGRVIPTNPNAASRVQSQDNVGGQTSGGMPVNPLPFLAQENANIKTIIGTEGTEPVYYSGRPRDGLLGTYDAVVGNPLKNWFRRTWAKINDPYKVLPSPTEEQTAEIKRRASELATKPYHTFHNYAENAGIEVTQEQGAQVTEDITGLDMETIYETMATRQVAMESEGKVPTGLELAYRTGTQVAWTTAMGFLGAAEWVVRQGASVVKTLDDVADKAAGADDPASIQVVDSVLSYQAELQKKNEALYNLTQRIPIMNKNVLEFAKALYNLTPYEIFKDAGRLIANLDNVKEGQFLKTLNSNLAGSQMVYSMLSSATTNEMYIKRYEEGESPLKLVAELQNPTQELLGGVFLDPTTYAVAGTKVYDEGKRILDNAVKGAADVKVADVLKDTRAPEVIKKAVADLQKITEGNSPKTTQEVLDSIDSVVKTVKQEFDTWKNARGFTSLTSAAKQSVLLEEAKDFFGHMAARASQLPDGIDRITETVSAMIRVSKGGTDNEIKEAVAALGNSPFGDVVLSPRSMRIAHMMSSVSEELPNIAKAIDEGDVSKVANIYAKQVDKFADGIKSVNEMAAIAEKVKKGVDVTPEMQKVADEFKALPTNVKFFNGLNELGKKTWMKPMSFLANIYFGFNRFAYPTRNVISAIPGMGYELGFADAVEVASKAISGSQVEKLGVDMLEKTTSEIERLVGFIPGAAMRGDTPIGQFVNTTKKYLGIIRGGGEVAQLSEQIMGAEIVLKTIKRELRNSLKYGAIPDTADLVKAGLNVEDAKALVAYTMEHGGDVGKVVDSFRKFMGGAEETFRHIPMNERLQGFLDHVDNGNSIYKELDNTLKNAQSVEEWRMAADAAWKKMEGLGEFSRTDVVNFSDDIPQSFTDDVKEAQRLRTVAPERIDSFQRVVQASRNARNQFVEVEESMKLFLQSQAPDVPFNQLFGPSIANIRKQADALEQADSVRNLVNQLSNDSTLTPVEMYARLNSLVDAKNIKSYGISKFTEIDPAKLTPKEMKSVMWESYFAWRGQHYADKMNDYVAEMTAVFESMAQMAGMTVAQAAKAANAPLQKAVDSVEDTYKFLVQQNIDVMSFTRRFTPDGTTLADVSIDAIKQAGFNSQSHLFNTINKYRKTMGERPWQTFEQVPMWEVQDAARRMKRDLGFVPTDPKQDMLTGAYELMQHPPLANDQPVTQSRMFFDSLENAKGDFDKYVDDIASRWGETTAPAGALTDEVELALGKWAQTLQTRMATAQNEAAMVASATRDALLYDYRKTLGNVAAQYISPFHYYHVSASKQWLYNTAADPKWGAIYIDFKENRAAQYAGLPDYWKQNIAVSGLLGIDPKNPLFFNIEASVNPIYQMMGVEYNSPEKRADWFSSSMDSLAKIVPGLYQPLQWVVAAELYAKGEKEASNLWLGRMFPQTKVIKSAANALGINIPTPFKYNETDPFVGVFMDGLDSSETKRALLYLSTITEVNGVPVTEEQRIQAAHEHTGPIWDEAVRDSLSARALPEAISYFMGVGYKPRTQTDIVTEQFYTDYRKLIAARSVMTEDQFTAAWQALRERSATNGVSMDVLLIGRKAGEDRDTAFNYNVLSRIPPGQLSDIADFVGIKPYMIEDFYANKGDMSTWTESDKLRFNAAMLDLSAMLTMPDNATRQEWTTAKSEYKDMQEGLKDTFGENILDQINTYFDLTDGEKEDYLTIFPQVEYALKMQTAYIATNPILSPYYNSLNTVNRYETNKMYDQLEREFGSGITDKADQYYYLKDEGREDDAKALYQQEGLKAYFKRKIQLQQEVNIRVANSVSMLPDNGEFGIRPEFQPQSGIQTDALNYATGPSQETQIATDVWGQLSQPYQNLIRDYYNGADLPYSVEKRLDYLGRDYGMSKEELLRILGAEVVR